MTDLKRAKWMLAIVVFGLVVSGITVWPAVPELLDAADRSGAIAHKPVLSTREGDLHEREEGIGKDRCG